MTSLSAAYILIADDTDVEINNTRISIPEVVPQEDLQRVPVQMIIMDDNIGQEGNETFTLQFGGLFAENTSLRNNLSGIVLDSTGKNT